MLTDRVGPRPETISTQWAMRAHCEFAPARTPPEKAWFRLVIALLCAASFVVSAALLDEEVTSVRRARG